MNAPEYINDAHEALLRADDALSVTDVAREIHGAAKPNKTQIKAAERQLKQINGLGLIAPEFRTGGVAFYRLIVAPAAQVGDMGVADIAQPAECAAASGDSEGGETDAPAARIPAPEYDPASVAFPADFASDPALQYLAPEDYEMPPADPKLLAMANRALHDQAQEFRGQLSSIAATVAEYLPDPSNISTARAVEILDMLADAQSKYIRMLELDAKGAHGVADSLQRQITELRTRAAEQAAQYQADIARISSGLAAERQAMNNAINEADRLRAELAAERLARTALQEQVDNPPAPVAQGYAVKAPKRPLRRFGKEAAAKSAAMAAARLAGRGEVFALVPLGVAVRGAKWKEA